MAYTLRIKTRIPNKPDLSSDPAYLSKGISHHSSYSSPATPAVFAFFKNDEFILALRALCVFFCVQNSLLNNICLYLYLLYRSPLDVAFPKMPSLGFFSHHTQFFSLVTLTVYNLNLSIYFLAFPLLKWKLHEAKNCVCFGHMMDSEPGT